MFRATGPQSHIVSPNNSTKQHPVPQPFAPVQARHSEGLQKQKSCRNLTSESTPSSIVRSLSGDDTTIYNASEVSYTDHGGSGSDKENTSPNIHGVSRPPSLDQKKLPTSSNHVQNTVRFVNKPNSTPLCTIIEQRSFATLHSKASNLTFKIRATQEHGKRKCSKENLNIILRGPKPASADDVMFQNRTGMTRDVSATNSLPTSDIFYSQPLEPPFQPPHRISTPKGIESWPGETIAPTQSRTGISFSHVSRTILRRALRERTISLRSAISNPWNSTRKRRQVDHCRPWRPPVSGHATAGYTTTSQHPFQRAPIAPVLPPSMGANTSTAARCREASQTPIRRVSSAQRALGAVCGNAIPTQASPDDRPRTSSMPKSLVRSSLLHSRLDCTISPPNVPDEAYPSDTLRTVDMIARFPRPPTSPGTLISPGPRPPLPLFSPRPLRVASVRLIEDYTTCRTTPTSRMRTYIPDFQSSAPPDQGTEENDESDDSAISLALADRPGRET